MADLITGLISALFEELFAATGRRLLGLAGWRRPHDIVCVFTGLAFWIVVGVLAYVILHR
jgi:hypothetical protein